MNIALLLSGGIGSRLPSKQPKQYILVSGKMIISYTLEILCCHPEIDAIQIVANPDWQDKILEQMRTFHIDDTKVYGFSIPGENRQMSIYHGLCDIKQYAMENDAVLIHDAVRPCVSNHLISTCFHALKKYDGVIPVLPMTDTVYRSEDGKYISQLLNRNQIYAGQAPEGFRLGKYLQANEVLLPEKILHINGSTEPAILSGMDVVMIDGEKDNFKITTSSDLERFKQLKGENLE